MIRQLKYGLTQLFLLAHKKYLKASLPLASVSNLSYPLSGLKLVVFLQNGLIKRRLGLIKVIIEKSRGEVSLVEQNAIENVS